MREFTKKEIEICKKIAEKERKKLNDGDWIRYEYGKPTIHLVSELCRNTHLKFTDEKHYFPLWQEHDCLEFLREKFPSILIQYVWEEWSVTISMKGDIVTPSFRYDGKTPLEALLRAVLEVLNNED